MRTKLILAAAAVAACIMAAAACRPSHTLERLDRAAAANRFAFVFFFDRNDAPTKRLRAVFDSAVQSAPGNPEAIEVRTGDPAEKAIVKKYEVDYAKQPVVMVFAPTGANTGWFPAPFTVPQLLEAIVSPATQQCLGAIQNRKIVLLSLQNAQTRLNDEAMKGVNAFAADTHYGRNVKVVRADPADTAEAAFMAQLKVDPHTSVATTVVMIPPGTVVGKFTGETEEDFMLTAVNAAQAPKSRIPGMDGQIPGSP